MKIIRWTLLIVFLALSLVLILRAASGHGLSRSTSHIEAIAAVSFVLLFCLGTSQVARSSGASGRLTLAIPLLTALPFLLTINSPFLSDSYSHVVTASQKSFSDVLRLFVIHPVSGDFFFRPLGYIDYWIDGKWAGFSPWRWHLANLLLHVAATFLVYILARYLGLSPVAGAFASLFFGLHGSNPEVVAWIAARFDELATLFVLLTLILCRRYEKTGKSFGFLLLTCMCALLSKESAFCLPLLVVCCELYCPQNRRRCVEAMAGLVLVCVITLTYRFWVIGGIGGYKDAAGHSTLLHFDLVKMMEALLLRLWSVMLFPINWSIAPESWLVIAWVIGLAAAVGVAVMAKPVRRRILSSLAFAIAALLPASHLSLLDASLLGSRVLHLSVIGMALFIGALYEGIGNKARAALAISGLCLFQCAVLVHNLLIWDATAQLAGQACLVVANASTEGPVTVIGLPRTHNGIFFFANGFPDCLYMNSGKRVSIIESDAALSDGPTFEWQADQNALKRIR